MTMQGFIDLVVHAVHDGSNASDLQPTTAAKLKSNVHRALEIFTFACAFFSSSVWATSWICELCFLNYFAIDGVFGWMKDAG